MEKGLTVDENGDLHAVEGQQLVGGVDLQALGHFLFL